MRAQAGLGDLGVKTGQISAAIDSRLRVVLRVERHRLQRTLMQVRAYSPQFAATVEEVKRRQAALKQRVNLGARD